MSRSRRVVLFLVIAAIVLFLGLLFWPFIVNNIIKPTALVVWLLLRILILSIHQKYFWYAVVVAAIIVLFRLLPRIQPEIPSDGYLETNSTMINIGYWRSLLVYDGQRIQEARNLKRELIHLLTSVYASKQNISNNFSVQDALQEGKFPLPTNIHTFLFSQDPPLSDGLLNKLFQSIRKIFIARIHKWTGQEKKEHYQMINEVFNFVERSLEIKNDDTKSLQN